jgi:hypothetical protein
VLGICAYCAALFLPNSPRNVRCESCRKRNITAASPRCSQCNDLMPVARGSLPSGAATCQGCRRAKAQSSYRSRATSCAVQWKPCLYCDTWLSRPCRSICGSAACEKLRYKAYRPPVQRASCQRCGASLIRKGNDCCGKCRRRDRDAIRDHRQRAQQYGSKYEPIDRLSIFTRDEWVCGLCEKPVDPTKRYPHPRSASLDHVIPLSRGGDHIPSNVQCAHLDCNIAKGARVAA